MKQIAGLAITALLLAGSGASAQSDKLSAILSDENRTVAYTPCPPGEEAGECLVHVITCRPNEVYGSGLELTIIGQGQGGDAGPDILAMARSLIDKPYGEAKLRFTIGGQPIEISTSAIIVSGNELNGDWDLTVRSMDDGDFFNALTPASSEKVSIEIGGASVILTNSKAHADALMKFDTACGR